MPRQRDTISPGRPHPLGSRPHAGGVGFSVYSQHAERVELLLYEHADSAQPARTISLEPPTHRTWNYWHVFVAGLRPGQLYAYRVHGPYDPVRGHRFDPSKVLLDPYARAVAVPSDWRRDAGAGVGVAPGDAHACKSVVADDQGYDWQGDRPLRRPFAQTLIDLAAIGIAGKLCGGAQHVVGLAAEVVQGIAGEFEEGRIGGDDAAASVDFEHGQGAADRVGQPFEFGGAAPGLGDVHQDTVNPLQLAIGIPFAAAGFGYPDLSPVPGAQAILDHVGLVFGQGLADSLRDDHVVVRVD